MDGGKVIKRKAKHGPHGPARSSERHFINALKSPSFYMRVLFNKFGLKPPYTQRHTASERAGIARANGYADPAILV